MSLIVGDSSALIALATMDALPLLSQLYDRIFVPESVYQEVTQTEKAHALGLSNYLVNARCKVTTENNAKLIWLGQGEWDAIQLYQQKQADLLLIDDQRAKRFAALQGVKMIGSQGIVLLAKQNKLIETVLPYLQRLQGSGIYLSQDIINKVLALANESPFTD